MSRLFRIFLSVASGLLLSLPWLGFPGWALFVAFLPLLLLDDFFLRNRDRFASVSFWSHSFLAFLVWNGTTTWWILHATPAGALTAILLNSFLMSLVFWLAHIVRRRTSGSLGYMAFMFFWITFEYIHFNWDIEWPWLTLGNGFANNATLVQWYEFTGALGGSLWIWLVTIFLFSLLKVVAEKGEKRLLIFNGVLLLLLIAIPSGWSVYRYHSYVEKVNPRKVLIIQPNIDPYSEAFDDGAVNDKIMKFIRLTESNMEPDIQYIVGPETVFEQNWKEDLLMALPAFRQVHALTQSSGNPSLVIGATTYRIYEDPGSASATARQSRDGMVYDVFNSSVFTDASGDYQIYHKSVLVPGVEKMPYRKYLKFLENFIIDLGGTSGSLGVQAEPTNFITPSGDQIASSICYESAFGGYMAQFVRKGAGIIFVITNDGWWKNTPGYKQHFSFSRLRAIETRRYVVRSANTGISGIINQRGEVAERSQWWTEAVIKGSVNYNEALTFYVRNGDYIGRILSFFSALLLISVLSTSIVRAKKSRT